MIKILRENHDLILKWAKSLSHEKMASIDFGGWFNGQIMTPLMVRHDLMPDKIKEIFSDPLFRQIIYIDVKPHSSIPRHNHSAMSHYRINDRGGVEYFPFTGDFYKVTHFTISAPDDDNVFMHIKGKKHYWKVGEFEEFDVIDNYHYVINGASESVKILYIEYYQESKES